MKRLRFSDLFLLAAVIIFAASRNIYTSIILMFASVYMLIDVVPKFWREWKELREEADIIL